MNQITKQMQWQKDYRWRENVPNYDLRIVTEHAEELCEGVTYLQRDYVRNDGKPVQTYIVIAAKDAPAKAAVWCCPQGQSQTVPEHVAEMERMGKQVVAAVNADFFHFFNDGDKKTYGAQIVDGVVYKEPNLEGRYGNNWFGVTRDGEYVLDDLQGYERAYKGKLTQAVGGGVVLMKDGKPCFPSTSADYRTDVGITKDGDLIIVTIYNANYAFATQVFMDLDMDVVDILNLDGGGSTTLHGQDESGTLTRLLCETPMERGVADSIAIVKKK